MSALRQLVQWQPVPWQLVPDNSSHVTSGWQLAPYDDDNADADADGQQPTPMADSRCCRESNADAEREADNDVGGGVGRGAWGSQLSGTNCQGTSRHWANWRSLIMSIRVKGERRKYGDSNPQNVPRFYFLQQAEANPWSGNSSPIHLSCNSWVQGFAVPTSFFILLMRSCSTIV